MSNFERRRDTREAALRRAATDRIMDVPQIASELAGVVPDARFPGHGEHRPDWHRPGGSVSAATDHEVSLMLGLD